MKRNKLLPKTKKVIHSKNKKHLCLSVFICGLFSFCLIVFIFWSGVYSPKVSAATEEESTNEIEKSLYTRQEFFGAQALVPLPTAEARDNLAKLAESQPDNLLILEKLAAFDEKLWRFDEAENILIHSSEIDQARLENLAAFYERRASFEKEAAVLRKILSVAGAEKRALTFERLINLARKNELKEYLQSDFYAQIAKENPNSEAVFESLADNLIEEKNYADALTLVRQAKSQFPERRSVLLEKEIDILLAEKQPNEAEKVYQAAFDPFWSENEAGKFYDFLNTQDRLRAYGAEVKARFKKNPADFDAAIRLALYRNHDYSYGNDDLAPIILQLEQAKKNWTTEELVTVTRLLLKSNEGDLASRFLYTLYLREDFKNNPELRAKILYQLFEMFSDAESQALSISKGNLHFYEDVAKTDTSPGISTGILSLIFSDTRPAEKLGEQEAKATKLYNRAAAYQIFLEYKKEFPASSELAQMYLDIVRLYTALGKLEIAETTLNEFAEKYENSTDYPVAALKLADAFIAAKQADKTGAVYQKVLDYLGRQNAPLAPEIPQEIRIASNLPSASSTPEISTNPNDGINIPPTDKKSENNYYDEYEPIVFHDYLAKKTEKITYADVLGKLVALLAQDKKTVEILALYSNEIEKHPAEEWLYEQRLSWLEQTNLTEEQLKAYQTALAKFQTRSWQDKLTRWFLRQHRQQDLSEFSQGLVGKLKDVELENYLSQFAGGNVGADEFEKQLFLKLYSSAHQRFPHNLAFVQSLLQFYKNSGQKEDWKNLAAEYYFESKDIRQLFLDELAKNGRLRESVSTAPTEGTVYELFRADAYARLSDYENAVEAYRKLNQLYPNTPEFSTRLVNFTRSFGQKNRDTLTESANVAQAEADFSPSYASYRTQSGEIFAELGNYQKSREEWEKLITTASGKKEVYLDAATVYWDYYQYNDALRTIRNLRQKFADETLYAFETGAIYEAQHKQTEALGEYVKALDADDSDESQKEKAKKRLVFLYHRDKNDISKNQTAEIALEKTIDAAFSKESARRRDASALALGYAEFLLKIKRGEKAENVLNRAIGRSTDQKFIESARDLYQSETDQPGEKFALERLTQVTRSPRQAIASRFQLAEFFEEHQDRHAAKNILLKLVKDFPVNYGVITESANFYSRLGFENESIEVLQNALSRSRGKYRDALAQKLAVRLIKTNRLETAEQILTKLHEGEPADTEVFSQLARIYVRLGDAGKLRKVFGETVAALRDEDTERRELNEQIAGLRIEMIEAFTRLKDYKSAIEQHIEIINRDPDDEELTGNAVSYVQRYGGADILLAYYQKLAAQSFKNYRWNVVLARIYEAKNDQENAAKNYRAAIDNQPEMIDLYVSLADTEVKRNNFDEALKNLDKVLELTNDAPEYIKKKIEILKKAGRLAEAKTEAAKLPTEAKPKITTDEFSEARKLPSTEKDQARQLYREAFAKLLENPLSGELKAADISGYVRSVREEESLAAINEKLWQLRAQLLEKIDEDNSTEAGTARQRLPILEGALTESIGNLAKTVATDEELAALHANLNQRIEETAPGNDKHQTAALILDLSRRAGFGDLEEKILLRKLDTATLSSDRQIYLQNLVNFYNERGAYQKAFDALQKYESDDLSLKADAARLVNNRRKELEALREIYWKDKNELNPTPDSMIDRYLDILYAENRQELKSLTDKSSASQLQLINFLLGKGEKDLAQAAIENANFSPSWKLSRHAETSLALKDFSPAAEDYFAVALQFDTIGNLIRQNPDKKQFLIGDEWYRLTREYGEWLFENQNKKIPPDRFLASMIENQPRNQGEQFNLGEFYLGKRELKTAIEHFRLALELEPGNKNVWAHLGTAYYLAGNRNWAEDSWKNVVEDGEISSGKILLDVLQKYGLADQANEKLPPLIVKFLASSDADRSPDFQDLIRASAASFKDETKKSTYFLQVLKLRPTDTSLAEMLINESLIAEDRRDEFYELLIARHQSSEGYYSDYKFTSVAQKTFTKADAESIYDQENKYQTEEPESEHFNWQTKYLKFLVEHGENQKAEKLILEIEKYLNGHYAAPPSLRLAKIQLQIRAGNFDAAEIERFIGISVSESAAEINPPNLERFNDVLQILKEEKRSAETLQISEAFFARMLALGQFNQSNLMGLARVYFQKGETEKALQILQLMVDANDEAKKETALAEISQLDIVKSKSANTVKLPEDESIDSADQLNSFDRSNSLKLAASLSAEFGHKDTAINYRRQVLTIDPNDTANQIELAKLLIAGGEKTEAVNILTQLINNRDSLRSIRWQAQIILRETDATTKILDAKFDTLSQFYNGLLAEKAGQNETALAFLINSLIVDKDAEVAARQELIKLYAASNQFSAALKIAEIDKSAKSDDLLQTLSVAAEKTGEFGRAISYEQARTNVDQPRIERLRQLANEKNAKATTFMIDAENTRKL